GTAQGARLPAELLSPAEVPELPEWSARARRPLTESRILKEVGTGTLESGRVMALHRTALTRARLYAHHLRLLATFFREDPEVRGRPEDADLSALKIAAGLRCTFDQAWSQVRDARTAVEIMPLTFEYLRRGDLTEAMHQTLLRRVRRLTDDQAAQVDAYMATVELPSVSVDTFSRHLRLAVEQATAGTVPAPPSRCRAVEIVDIDTTTGTASPRVTRPLRETRALAHPRAVSDRASRPPPPPRAPSRPRPRGAATWRSSTSTPPRGPPRCWSPGRSSRSGPSPTASTSPPATYSGPSAPPSPRVPGGRSPSTSTRTSQSGAGRPPCAPCATRSSPTPCSTPIRCRRPPARTSSWSPCPS